jgi:hypothetical protein
MIYDFRVIRKSTLNGTDSLDLRKFAEISGFNYPTPRVCRASIAAALAAVCLL